MNYIKKNYIDSHWLVFIFQGVIALLTGCVALFTGNNTASSIIPIIGLFLLGMSMVEFANSIYRSYNRHGWVVSFLVAIFDALFGLILLVMVNEAAIWHLAILATYTIVRGLFEIVIGFRTTDDPTDRFIWVLCGICGAIFGFVIFNSGQLSNIDFVRFFGAYMLILGICSLIYGVANHVQKREYYDALAADAKEARKRKRSATKTTKTTSSATKTAKSARKKSLGKK